MIIVNSYKLIIVVYMSHYLVLLILEFLPARLAMLPYGLDSNVTQLLASMLTKPSVFYCLPIVPCNLVSIKLLLLLLLRCRTSQFARSFLPAQVRKWNEWPFIHCVWHGNAGLVQGCSKSLVASVNFFSFFRGEGACGVAKTIYKQLCFPTWTCAAGFNNNNNT